MTRTFVVLYITVGLGESLDDSTAVLAAVAGGYVVAASSRAAVGDRLGLARVIARLRRDLRRRARRRRVRDATGTPGTCRSSSASRSPAGAVMTLAWGLLFKLMPDGDRGAVAGPRDVDEGRRAPRSGRCSPAPRSTSLAPYLEQTQGYQIVWPIAGIPILLVDAAPRASVRGRVSGRPARRARGARSPRPVADDVDGGPPPGVSRG